ncbi:MAG: GtrA family protein [Rhodospirillales bacterium]|nr:GtrA family protein [Alphaproteobacteria bacterium]MCB1840108.1 GtrA family protein [Alphaproteobacteria bacterium]MCB9976693.1 GtrA family protein [Rhodospirillales bacterium]
MRNIVKSHYKRFSKFAAVGVLNTVIDYSVFSLLRYGFGVYYIFAHVSGFIIANANSFFLNSLWTFKKLRRDTFWQQASKFFLISLVGLGFSTVALYFAVELLSLYLHENLLPDLWGKVFASGVSMMWNYIGSWLFIFKEKEEGQDAQT